MTTRAAIDLFNLTVPGATTTPPPVVRPAPKQPAPPVAFSPPPVVRQPPEPKPHQRPPQRPADADAIDAIVAGMVADGLVTLDAETDSYRSTRKRHWRFPEVEA